MKSILKYALLVSIGALLLAGCCTAHHTQHWEYKVDYAKKDPGNDPKAQEAFLNEQARDGWMFIQRDATGLFYFKRAKH